MYKVIELDPCTYLDHLVQIALGEFGPHAVASPPLFSTVDEWAIKAWVTFCSILTPERCAEIGFGLGNHYPTIRYNAQDFDEPEKNGTWSVGIESRDHDYYTGLSSFFEFEFTRPTLAHAICLCIVNIYEAKKPHFPQYGRKK